MPLAAGETAWPANHDTSRAPPLANVVYSSRAVAPFSDPDLQSLMQTAQARNQRESVTGVLLYDDSQFFQWLEGPADGVGRIMGSIQNDGRHTDVQVIAKRAATARRFRGWDMKLASQGANPAAWRQEILRPPREIIEVLHREPTAAPALLVKLAPSLAGTDDTALAASLAGKVLSRAAAAVLKRVILEKVIPRLLDSHETLPTPPERLRASPRASELAELLVATDQAASLELIRELRGDHVGGRHLFAPLFEPAARSLGDMWEDDVVSEFEVTLGLCRLQTAIRLLGADCPRAALRLVQPQVMIAPMPGELHQLVAALDSEWLWSEGWAPRSVFPSDDRALTDLLSATWVDVLDLSLSAAFRRGEALPRLTETITLARRASLNPDVVVVVGGRAFAEDQTSGLDVGADLASRTSMHLDRLMAHDGAKPKAGEDT